MPVDWKADIPFKTFIVRRESLHKRHSAAHTNGSLIHSISSMSQVRKRPSAENQPTIVQSPTIKENKDDLHDVEGILEMQKMLLGKLARRENTVKELVYHHGKRSMNGQRVMGLSWENSGHLPAPEADPLQKLTLKGGREKWLTRFTQFGAGQGKSKSIRYFDVLGTMKTR